MTIQELITSVKQYATHNGCSFYTSKRLSENPDVCHAACIWFLEQMKSKTLTTVVSMLQILDKNSLQRSQGEIHKARSEHQNKLLETLKKAGPTDSDLEAMEHVLKILETPASTSYADNVRTAGDIVAAVTTMKHAGKSGSLMVFMKPKKGDSGHVICLIASVNKVVVYDPNLGIIEAPLNVANVNHVWLYLLGRIFRWYHDNMELVNFAFLQTEF